MSEITKWKLDLWAALWQPLIVSAAVHRFELDTRVPDRVYEKLQHIRFRTFKFLSQIQRSPYSVINTTSPYARHHMAAQGFPR